MPPQFENNIIPPNPPRSHVFLITLAILLIFTGIFSVWYFSNPLPEEETESLTSTDQFTSWKTFTNTKYGYSISYSDDLNGPISQCGGEGSFYVAPAEVCNQVLINLEPRYNYSFGEIKLTVIDNKQNLEPEVYLKKILTSDRTRLASDILKKKYGEKHAASATFQGAMSYSVDSSMGGDTEDNERGLILVDIGNSELLRITYPTKFCSGAFLSQCYSNEKNVLFEQIVSTLKFISTSTPILGGDKDEHGCIGSAGYSWCEVKNKCLRTWEEKCE